MDTSPARSGRQRWYSRAAVLGDLGGIHGLPDAAQVADAGKALTAESTEERKRSSPERTRRDANAGMAYESIKLEKKNQIGYVTIDRPKVLNALNMQTMQEL